MNFKISTLIILTFFSACSSIPEIHESQSRLNKIIFKKCHGPFLTRTETSIHSIQASLRGKKAAPLIGVTTANPHTRKIHSALMSIEGLVLFEAVNDNKLTINRAVKPFDSETFARGMIDDINLIFFKPEGKLTRKGIMQNGSMVCRYKNNDKTTDIIYDQHSKWTINVYLKKHLSKKVKIYNPAQERKQGRIILNSYGKNKYKLDMKLIRKE